MRAAVFDETGLRFRHDHEATRGHGEVPVRVTLAGICETDLQLVRGYMGFRGVLGHEFVGVAEAGTFAGHRVTAEINCPCRHCDYCQQGLANHCPARSVIGILGHDGAFAERVYVPEANLHPVPDSLSDELAVFTEPLAAAFQIPAQVDLSAHRRAAVIGEGRMSWLIAQVLRLHGLDVTVVGKHPAKLQRFAAQGFRTASHDHPAGRQFPLAVDCSGSRSGVPTALQWLRPRGILVLKTTTCDQEGPSWAPLVIDEITVVGSRCGPFAAALQALQQQQIDVRSLITAQYPLERVADAFTAAAAPDHGKVLLAP